EPFDSAQGKLASKAKKCLPFDSAPTRLAEALAKRAALRSGNMDTLKIILEREPELLKKLLPFLKKYPKPDIDYIAVTHGPGLEPALWVGVNFARALSYFWNIPILPINHIEGHIAANWSNEKFNAPHPPLKLRGGKGELFPTIALIVSGGHTQLILIKKIGGYAIIGETRDDAAGEAFDKVAKMLNLGYPGGPAISRLAEKWKSQIQNPKSKTNHLSLITNHFSLPRPMLNSGDFDFSFSGLKTAVLYALQKMTPARIKKLTPAIAAEFQQAVVDVLSAKTLTAVKKYDAKTIILAGGVAANKALRDNLSLITKRLSLNFLVPPINLCLDNAAMIALAAYWQLEQKRAAKTSWRTLKAQANLRIS
ncbi:tRNA (adenosine(37)-N6)-threonylcarbamoyltransferase complex transferase subunit TsaD, partial [Patescibacteria group bacterium]|nr:tRNA (adenosine(37)-N6)-threonylcarbamoyltransferase complex transferase subunit TsaD [Patescibacteria group bacterium]